MEDKKVTIGGWRKGFDPVGKLIDAIYVGDGNNTMLIKADGVYYKFYAEGDCCSYSWVSNIEISPRINRDLGYRCISLKEMESELFDKDYDLIQVYGYELEFDDGSLFITYRNSSNGYYGGWLEFLGEYDGLLDGFKKIQDRFTCEFI